MAVQLNTRYLGIDLKNPLVASSSPLCGHIDTLLRLEDSGVSAVVLPSRSSRSFTSSWSWLD